MSVEKLQNVGTLTRSMASASHAADDLAACLLTWRTVRVVAARDARLLRDPGEPARTPSRSKVA